MATSAPLPVSWIPEDDLLLKNAIEVFLDSMLFFSHEFLIVLFFRIVVSPFGTFVLMFLQIFNV